MTPHEKAKEILSKLYPFTDGWINRRAVANIMVDEILLVTIDENYWERVKQEIKAL